MESSLVVNAVVAILGIGGGSWVTTIMQGRSTARRIDAETTAINARTPAEVDSVALQGAESAVRVLQQANETLVNNAQRLEVENARLRSQLEQMELKLEQAKARATAAENALSAAMDQLKLVQADYAQMSTELETFRSETQHRG